MSEPSPQTNDPFGPTVERSLESRERREQLERESAHKAAKRRVQDRFHMIIHNVTRVAAANRSKTQPWQGGGRGESPVKGSEGDKTSGNKQAPKAAVQGDGNKGSMQPSQTPKPIFVAAVTILNRQKLEKAYIAAHHNNDTVSILTLGGQLFPQHPGDLSDPMAQTRRWLGITQFLALHGISPFGGKCRNKLMRVSLNALYEAYEHAVLQLVLRMNSLYQLYEKYPPEKRDGQDVLVEGGEKMSLLQRSRKEWLLLDKEIGIERSRCVNLTLMACCEYGGIEAEMVRLKELYPHEALFRRDRLHRALVLEN